jgi:hypothetical protein
MINPREEHARKVAALTAAALDCRAGKPHIAPAWYDAVSKDGSRLRICRYHAIRVVRALQSNGETGIVSVVARTAASVKADQARC